jgi:hypothetical protein
MQVSTLRPGLLVSLKTSISGNVSYATRDLEAEHTDDDGARRARWETQKTIAAPKEFELATQMRGKARSLITAICSPSSFGLLCPENRREALEEATAEARRVIDEFNRGATMTRIGLYLIAGRIAVDDREAIRAINSEMRDLLETMENGLQRLDVKAVRDAADKARSLGAMLSPEAEARLSAAVTAARSMARRIVKAGEGVSIEIDRQTIRTLRDSRTAFLDLEDGEEVQEPETVERAIEMDVAPVTVPVPPRALAPLFDFN